MHSFLWRILRNVLKNNKGKSLLMVATIAGSIVAALLPPLILGEMIDALSHQKAILLSVAFLYFITFAAAGFLESLQNILITRMGQAITHEMRTQMSKKLERLPASYFTKNETGKITSRFVNDVDAVDSLFTNGIVGMFADAFKILSILFIIFQKSRGLGILLCLAAPLLFLMTLHFQKKMRRAQLANRAAIARVNAHVPETIQNIRMIHTFSCEQFMEEKYTSYIEESYRAMDKSNFYDSIYSPIVIFTSALLIGVMMVCSSFGSSMQEFFGMSIGSAVAVIAYVGKVFDPLESLGMEIQNIQGALAGVERMDAFLGEKEMEYPEKEPAIGKISRKEFSTKESFEKELPKKEQKFGSGEEEAFLVFEEISFAYDEGKPVFSNCNLRIRKGENVVFTGRTGAGKSTLFKLLLGLYPPSHGKITIQGKETSTLSEEERRKLFGYVGQHFTIVDGTIREQLRLFDDTIRDAMLWEALEKCGLSKKIENLPGKLDGKMNLSDFSQGELQLLSIARALAANPEILLLDEITANLDSATEERLLKIIGEAAEDKTVISISHRMSKAMKNVRILPISQL